MPRPTIMIKIALGILGVALVLGVWLMLSADEAKKLKPPSSVTTIQDFLQQMPTPTHVRKFAFGEAIYYEVWGQLGGTIRLPSGPPSYVFDPNGRLVDWTSDRGDAGNYNHKWVASKRHSSSLCKRCSRFCLERTPQHSHPQIERGQERGRKGNEPQANHSTRVAKFFKH